MYQQLREFCYEATAKRGTARQELVVETGELLLGWVVAQWEGTQLALALDATVTLGTRFTVLAISVVYRGCAIPVAWTGSWPPWPNMPGGGSGRACCARCTGRSHGPGPCSSRRIGACTRAGCFWRITRLGWHPLEGIDMGGTLRPTGQVRGVPLQTLVPEPGTTWQGTGIAFKGRDRQLHCTLLAFGKQGIRIRG